MRTIFKKLAQLAICVSAVTLVACGGGGSSTPVLTVQGVAATGLAIDSASGTATTLANGTYVVTITNGEGPCLVTVTKGDLVLRSIAPQSSSGTAVANVTAFSTAIVNALVQAKGASSVDALISNPSYTPSNTELKVAVSAAIVKINEALVNLGQAPLDPNTDLLGQPNFVAATSNVAGDALDKALDALVNNNGSLPNDLTTAITTTVDATVDPNATGSVN